MYKHGYLTNLKRENIKISKPADEIIEEYPYYIMVGNDSTVSQICFDKKPIGAIASNTGLYNNTDSDPLLDINLCLKMVRKKYCLIFVKWLLFRITLTIQLEYLRRQNLLQNTTFNHGVIQIQHLIIMVFILRIV